MTVYAFMCRGIGEVLNNNMLMGNGNVRGVRQYLDQRVVVTDVPWPASYGPTAGLGFGSSYGANLQRGITDLNLAIGSVNERIGGYKDSDRIALYGYSAGATLTGNFANTGLWRSRIAAVGLVADPMRPRGMGGVGPASGWGVGGERRVSGLPVVWAADPRDPITALEENSPVRTFADQSYAASFNPGQAPYWINDIAGKVTSAKWQQVAINWWNPIGVFQQYGRALDALDRYLWKGDHTSYGVRQGLRNGGGTYLKQLADDTNRAFKAWL